MDPNHPMLTPTAVGPESDPEDRPSAPRSHQGGQGGGWVAGLNRAGPGGCREILNWSLGLNLALAGLGVGVPEMAEPFETAAKGQAWASRFPRSNPTPVLSALNLRK